MSGISKDTFEKADTDTRFLIIFDLIVENNQMLAEHVTKQDVNCARQAASCGERFLKLENRKKIDSVMSTGAGVLGGFIAIIAKKIIG
jgi:hypothetical protein